MFEAGRLAGGDGQIYLLSSQLETSHGARRRLSLRHHTPQAPGKSQQQQAEDDSIQADHHDERQRSSAREDEQDQAEEHRRHPAKNEQPLIVDGAAQLDGFENLHDSGDDGPGGNERQQHQRGHPRPAEGEDANQDAGDAFDE
jgi:hypothetical protein